MKKLAINIITKNNEKKLEKCLKSVSLLDADIIIGFNGKQDSNEYRLCEQYANKLISIEWKNDFSYARNEVLKNTKNPWIMWIDSDEYLKNESINNLNNLIKQGPKNLYHNFKLIHGSIEMGQLRMFYNDYENIHWERKIHERIIPKNYPMNHYDIKVIHSVGNKENSHLRNITILEEELEKNINDPEINFYLAIEYHLMNKNMKSLMCAERFLHNYRNKDVDIKKIYMRYLIAYINFHYLNNHQKAINILMAQLILNCNIAEFWCLLGDIYMKIGHMKYAKQFYENAISMGNCKYDNMWMVDKEKYQLYPQMRIDICNKNLNLNIPEFNKKVNALNIP